MTSSAEIRQHLVDALRIDLIGPSWDDVARRHEQINQPPSVRYTTGFLVPHVFQQEAGRTTKEEQLSFSDLAGEEPSNVASNRLEKQEKEDDANDTLDQANTRRSWFPSSLGLSFITNQGASLEVVVSWGDYSAPVEGDKDKIWTRTPQRQPVTISIDGPGTSPDIPLEGNPQGLCLRWIARPAPKKLAKVKELGDVSKSELVRECGYVSTKKDGTERLNFTSFYEALLGAKGVSLGADSAGRGKGGRSLSYVATVQGNGNLLVGKAYTAVLDLLPGDEFEIKLGRKQIKLIPLGSPEEE